MKFLVLNASPHKNGGTYKFVTAFENAVKSVGGVRILNLHDDPPQYSRGSTRRETGLSTYQQAVLDCDALFIATPTYWFNVPAILKAFVEELDEIDKQLYEQPRALGVAVFAPQGGELGTASSLILALNHLNFALVEVGYIFHRGVPEDDWAWDDIAQMPERMKRVIS